jgi:hypothetical protein
MDNGTAPSGLLLMFQTTSIKDSGDKASIQNYSKIVNNTLLWRPEARSERQATGAIASGFTNQGPMKHT